MPTSVPVHYGNLTTKQFTGWQRATVDVLPTANGGSNVGGSTKYLLGQQRGSVRSLSLYVTTTSGQKATVDLNSLTGAAPIPLTPTPAQLGEIGQPVIAGVNMTLVESGMDGMFWTSYWRARVGTMFVVHLWTWWVPGQGWAEGEMLVACSNPSVGDIVDYIPSSFVLDWGTVTYPGTTYVPGITPGAVILPAGARFVDGQCRAFPVTVVWSGLLSGAVQTDSADAVQQQKLSVLGVQEVWPDLGNPAPYGTFNTASFISTNYPLELTRLHDWTAGTLGIIANGRDTGGEGDQIFTGTIAAQGQDGLLADKMIRLLGMLNARRPCHHHEATGDLLDLDGHPNLAIWDGRAFWYYPDRLGKSSEFSQSFTEGGWWGPWSEHFLANNLAIGCRITGSPLLQFLLRAWMRVSWFQQTLNGRTTDEFWAARSVGYEGIFGYHLHHGLWDATEKARWDTRKIGRLDHFATLMAAGPASPPGAGSVEQRMYNSEEMWQISYHDPRQIGDPPAYLHGTGKDPNWMTYQQPPGAFGLYLLARTYGHTACMALAVTAAQAVCDRAFQIEGGVWGLGWDYIWYDGSNSVPLIQSNGAHRDSGQGTWVWHTPGLIVVLWDNPNNARARAILEQYLIYTNYSYRDRQWLPPNYAALLATSTISNVEGSRGAWKNVATEMEAL